jgi:hypothetical protein
MKSLERFKNGWDEAQSPIVLKKLRDLTGHSLHKIPLLASGLDKGVIPKLKLLIKTLLQSFKEDPKPFLSLYEILEKIEARFLKQDLFFSRRCLNQIEECLKEMTPYFEKNENVLLFYLRKRKLFETFFSKNFIKTLFQEGGDEFKKTLLDGYRRRGFFTLLTSIEESLETLC